MQYMKKTKAGDGIVNPIHRKNISESVFIVTGTLFLNLNYVLLNKRTRN